jgi:hypothetical protein
LDKGAPSSNASKRECGYFFLPPFTLFFFADLAGFFAERDLAVCFFTRHCHPISPLMHELSQAGGFFLREQFARIRERQPHASAKNPGLKSRSAAEREDRSTAMGRIVIFFRASRSNRFS